MKIEIDEYIFNDEHEKMLISLLTLNVNKNIQNKNNEIRRIYISGPITGIPDLNKNEFEKYENILTRTGYEVVNPLKLIKENEKYQWQHYMSIDISMMMTCDTIVVLDNWSQSRGAKIEVSLSYFLGKRVLVAKTMQKLEHHFELKMHVGSSL